MDIYQRYGPAVLRKCERMLQNRQDAEDIVQALYTDLLKKGQTGVDLPYLYRAATNRCLNFIRDTKKRRSLLEQQGKASCPARTTLDDLIIDKQLLFKLVKRLDKKSSEILVYRFFDDMTQEEIAQMMNTSRKTVGIRLGQIREEVRMVRKEGGLG